MLLVDGLLGHAQFGRDRRPRPAKFTCPVDVQGLQLFGQPPKRRDGPEPNGRVLASCSGCQVQRGHVVNLFSTYWRPRWQRSQRLRPLPLAAALTAWFPVWTVLGVSRLHHLRTSGAEGRRSYRSPLARRRDTLAFLDTTIEAALALPAANPG